MRKPAFCICENKDADQLRGNREADQRLGFRYTDSSIPLLPKSKSSSLKPSSVTVQPGLCRTWSETPKTGFLTTRLKYMYPSQSGYYKLFPCRNGEWMPRLICVCLNHQKPHNWFVMMQATVHEFPTNCIMRNAKTKKRADQLSICAGQL